MRALSRSLADIVCPPRLPPRTRASTLTPVQPATQVRGFNWQRDSWDLESADLRSAPSPWSYPLLPAPRRLRRKPLIVHVHVALYTLRHARAALTGPALRLRCLTHLFFCNYHGKTLSATGPVGSRPDCGLLHIRYLMHNRLISLQDVHNPRKRRHSGHDPPAVSLSLLQDTLSPTAPAYSYSVAYSNDQMHIIEQAALLLKCPLSDLLALQGRSRRDLDVPDIVYPSPKRPRLNTNVPLMSSPEKSFPPDPATLRPSPRASRDDDTGDGFSMVNFFASLCRPYASCEPQGTYIHVMHP